MSAPGEIDIPVGGQLTLQRVEAPTNGPAWLVAPIGESGLQRHVLLGPAITGRDHVHGHESGEGLRGKSSQAGRSSETAIPP